MIKFLTYIIIFLPILACTDEQNGNAGRDAIAKAYGNYLYPADLNISEIDNLADSVNIYRNAIDNWLLENIILEKSKSQISGKDKKEIEQKVESYKNDLYTFAFQARIVRQKMDTLVADSLIKDYYEKYISNYMLEDPFCVSFM